MATTFFTLFVFIRVFPVSGGFAAVIYTDAIQTLIIVGGAFSLMFIGTAAVAGSQTSTSDSTGLDTAGLGVLQPSPGWDGTKDSLSSTWPPLRPLRSPTPRVTSLVVTPSTCSGTR